LATLGDAPKCRPAVDELFSRELPLGLGSQLEGQKHQARVGVFNNAQVLESSALIGMSGTSSLHTTRGLQAIAYLAILQKAGALDDVARLARLAQLDAHR
jgi:hypothetical protein